MKSNGPVKKIYMQGDPVNVHQSRSKKEKTNIRNEV